MKAKIKITETATYIVTVDVEDPDDEDEVTAAWVGMPSAEADLGLVGYDNRDIEVLDVTDEHVPPNAALDRLIGALESEYVRLLGERSQAQVEYRDNTAEALLNEAFGVKRAILRARRMRAEYEGTAR